MQYLWEVKQEVWSKTSKVPKAMQLTLLSRTITLPSKTLNLPRHQSLRLRMSQGCPKLMAQIRAHRMTPTLMIAKTKTQAK